MGGAVLVCLLLAGSSLLPLAAAADDVPDTPTPAEQAKNEAEAKSGEQLNEAIKEAADAQNYLQDADEKVVSKEVKQAPAAELANGAGDVATTGARRPRGEGRRPSTASRARAVASRKGARSVDDRNGVCEFATGREPSPLPGTTSSADLAGRRFAPHGCTVRQSPRSSAPLVVDRLSSC